MSRKNLITTMALLVVFYFVAGWFGYEWMLSFVTAEMKQSISATSLQEAFSHRLVTSVSLACVGVVVVVGARLGRRSALLNSNGRSFILLSLAAIVTMIGWMVVQAGRMTELSQKLASTPAMTETSLSITSIPLYEIGLVGSGCALLIAIVLGKISRASLD